VALVNSTTDTLKNAKLRERTDRAWFSCVLRHPARKWSKSILTTPGVKRCDNMYRDDLEKLVPCITPFKVTQGYRNWHTDRLPRTSYKWL